MPDSPDSTNPLLATTPKMCGRIMVGSGSDTYDPICELPEGHKRACRSRAAIDQHRLSTWGLSNAWEETTGADSVATIQRVLLDPPACMATAKVLDVLMAAPKIGRVKANKILADCRISPSKTVGGLTLRQRRELVDRVSS